MADNDTRDASTSEATAQEPAAPTGATAPSAGSEPTVQSSAADPAESRAEGPQPGAESSAADAGDDGDEGGDDEGGDDAGDASGDAAAAGTLPDGTPKKRKRRRRKKKGGASVAGLTAPGADGAPVEGGEATTEQPGGAPVNARQQQPRKQQQPKKDPAQVPFGRFFEGTPGTRRQAFSVGEVVAGRVTRTEYGTILVDLFGKAIAVVDELEPREVQFPPPAPEAPAEVAAGEPATSEAAPADGTATDAPVVAAAEAAPAEAAAQVEPTPAVAEAEEHAEVDHDDGGGDHEDAGTLAAPIDVPSTEASSAARYGRNGPDWGSKRQPPAKLAKYAMLASSAAGMPAPVLTVKNPL